MPLASAIWPSYIKPKISWPRPNPLLAGTHDQRKAPGPDHIEVADAASGLAELYVKLLGTRRPSQLHLRSLAYLEKALGPITPMSGSCSTTWRGLHRVRGRYAEAEALQQRSLAIREKALGPENTDVALSLGNLALVYQALGRYTEAEPM